MSKATTAANGSRLLPGRDKSTGGRRTVAVARQTEGGSRMTSESQRGAPALEQFRALVKWRGEPITISFRDVKTLICPLATEQETIVFLKTCQSLQLNPFAGEIYLIKYAIADKAAVVIAIESYLKSAELNDQYDGCEAGIILKTQLGPPEFREGAFLLDEEKSTLVGGWAKVYRKDRSRPTYVAVNKIECIKLTRDGDPTKFWAPAKQPWMLRKTALKRGLVEAFPSLFAGTMSTADVGADIQDAEYREILEGTLPPGFELEGKPNWRKFWVKVKDELGLTQEQARELLQVKSIKKDMIDRGWTMEQMWERLVQGVRGQQAGADPKTGEIIEEVSTTTDPAGNDAHTPPGTKPKRDPGSNRPQILSPQRSSSPAKPKRDPESIKSISDLTRACLQDFNMLLTDVCKELGYGSPQYITKLPAECYREIAAARGVE